MKVLFNSYVYYSPPYQSPRTITMCFAWKNSSKCKTLTYYPLDKCTCREERANVYFSVCISTTNSYIGAISIEQNKNVASHVEVLIQYARQLRFVMMLISRVNK